MKEVFWNFENKILVVLFNSGLKYTIKGTIGRRIYSKLIEKKF